MSEDWTVAATAPAPANPWADPHATIASILGPGQISSAARSAARNAAVGGSPTSSHLTAQAVDWIPADGNTRAAAQKLAASGVPYDQIIDEGTHLHVGFGPKMRQQALTSVPDSPWTPVSSAPDWTPVSPPPPVPKLPPKAVPVPPSLLDRVVSGAKQMGSNLESDIAERSHNARAGMKEGLADLQKGYDPNEDPWVPLVRQTVGAAKVVGGAFSAAMAPISGAAQDIVGRPVETVTKGALPKEMMGDYTDAMLGFVAPESLLTPKARAMRARAASEAAPAGEDWTPVTSEPAAPEGAPAAPMQEVGASHNRGVTIEAPEPANGNGIPETESNLEPLPANEDTGWNVEHETPVSANDFLTRPYDDLHSPDDEPQLPANDRPAAMAAEVEHPEDPTLEAPPPDTPGGPIVGDEADPVERLDNALYRLGGHNEAGKAEGLQFLKDNEDVVGNQGLQEELHNAIEQKLVDPNAEIPEHLQEAEVLRQPWAQRQLDAINRRRELGDPDAEDYQPDQGYVPRYVEGHDPLLDDATEGPARGDPIMSRKPGLTTSTASAKQRTAGYMVTDQDGNTHFTHELDPTDIMDRPYVSVRPATTAEVEANTGVTYNKNATVNTMRRALHDEAVVRHLEVLDELKKQMADQGLAHVDEHYFKGEDGLTNIVPANSERPEGFRQVPSIPQLRGVSFAPEIAEKLEDAYAPNHPLIETLSRVNRALTMPMFFNPLIHASNVGVHWGIGRGFDWVRPGGMKSLLYDGTSAIHQVWTQGPMYRELMRQGMGGQFIGQQTRDFHATVLKAAGKQMFGDPETANLFAKAARVPVAAVRAAYAAASKALWYVNDVLLMQRVMELQRKGMSTRDAIYEAEREIPNYRVPPRIGGTKSGAAGRTASLFLQNSAIGMFNRYKYGAARAWSALVKDLAKGDATQRTEAVGKLLVAITAATVIYPAMDWAAQKLTGNKDARFRRAGGLGMTDAAYDAATDAAKSNIGPDTLAQLPQGMQDSMNHSRDPSMSASTFFSPGPALSLSTGVVGNHDFFGHDIRTKGAPVWLQGPELAKYLATQGFYPGQLGADVVAGHPDKAAGKLVGLNLPSEEQQAAKAKYAGKDAKYANRAAAIFKNRVESGDLGDALTKLGKR